MKTSNLKSTPLRVSTALAAVTLAAALAGCDNGNDNNNDNNAEEPTPEKGVRVERTQTGGYRIFDLADTHRHHTVDGK